MSFDFLETIVFGGDGRPSRPYRSWATEKVLVLEDRPGFVSLQHLLVMFVVDDDGVLKGPFVQKHWRQEWRYEPTEILEFRGFERFRTRRLEGSERTGAWSQFVYEVDDSPRYTVLGRWEHTERFSTWQSADGWRPLPRREESVRDDYQVLRGTNRITIQPLGWTHEQDNLKSVLTEPGVVDVEVVARAREVGVNRYERIEGFDFSAGDAYWSETAAVWGEVRDAWSRRIANASALTIRRTCEDRPAFAIFFELTEANRPDSEAAGEAEGAATDPFARIESALDCLTTDAA